MLGVILPGMGEGDMLGVIPPGMGERTMVGIPPCVYASLVPWWVYTSLCICRVHHPGYTYHLCCPSVRLHVTDPLVHGTVRHRGAQSERNPWVGEGVRVNVVIPVTVDGRECAGLLRSS